MSVCINLLGLAITEHLLNNYQYAQPNNQGVFGFEGDLSLIFTLRFY